MKSEQSVNRCQSLPTGQAGVVQTFYDIVKVHGGELSFQLIIGGGSDLTIEMPLKSK